MFPGRSNTMQSRLPTAAVDWIGSRAKALKSTLPLPKGWLDGARGMRTAGAGYFLDAQSVEAWSFTDLVAGRHD